MSESDGRRTSSFFFMVTSSTLERFYILELETNQKDVITLRLYARFPIFPHFKKKFSLELQLKQGPWKHFSFGLSFCLLISSGVNTPHTLQQHTLRCKRMNR